MRLVFALLIAVPYISGAQINRSATELAGENIHSYLDSKFFRNTDWHFIDHGKLQERKNEENGIAWSIFYKIKSFEESHNVTKIPAKIYNIIFYLDRKMNVLFAESSLIYVKD